MSERTNERERRQQVGVGKYLERVVDEELAEARAHAEQKDVPHDLGVPAEADVRSED
jgi:hypothetical protein